MLILLSCSLSMKGQKRAFMLLHINALTLFYYKIVLAVVPYKLEFARFYKRCTGRTKSAMGACSQSADFRTGCIARQRDMSMKRSVMRMAPHYDNIFSCIGCFFHSKYSPNPSLHIHPQLGNFFIFQQFPHRPLNFFPF